MNPYMSNVDLWEIKTGRRKPDDISREPYVIYGTNAESSLRTLFALDHPEYIVDHCDYAIYTNEAYPFAHASLDGELVERDTGRCGILEIKTTEIMNSTMWGKWDNRIPDNYYLQVLHYLMVTELEFVVLVAQIKYRSGDSMRKQTREYMIERADVLQDIEYLAAEEKKFWQYVQQDKEPPRKLPQI